MTTRCTGPAPAAGATGRRRLRPGGHPETAGWGYPSLRIADAGARWPSTRFATGDERDDRRPAVRRRTVGSTAGHLGPGRARRRLRRPDRLRLLPVGIARSHAASGARRPVRPARGPDRDSLPFRYGPAAEVPVELRGAGQASRQVRNFGTPAPSAGKIIACEVITPGGNWSSYPAHKHDEAGHESELEEIYYFEIAAGPHGEPGFGFMRIAPRPAGDDRGPRGGARPRRRARPPAGTDRASPRPATTCTT